jgi:hypothetical protein
MMQIDNQVVIYPKTKNRGCTNGPTQVVISKLIIFFSHNKSANNIFNHDFFSKVNRTVTAKSGSS